MRSDTAQFGCLSEPIVRLGFYEGGDGCCGRSSGPWTLMRVWGLSSAVSSVWDERMALTEGSILEAAT